MNQAPKPSRNPYGITSSKRLAKISSHTYSQPPMTTSMSPPATSRPCGTDLQAGMFRPSSLRHDLGRVLRVKARPLRGRFASLDTSATAKGWQLRGGRGRARKQQVSVWFC